MKEAVQNKRNVLKNYKQEPTFVLSNDYIINSELHKLRAENENLKNEIAHLKSLKLQASIIDPYLFENVSGIAIQGYDLDGNIVFWNQTSERLLGYSPSEVIGKSMKDLIIASENNEKFIQCLKFGKKAKKSGEIIAPSEVDFLHKDGHRILLYSIHVISISDKKEKILLCINFDLSEQKKILSNIKQNEESLRLIIENQNAQIVKINPDGLLTYVSKTFCKFHGLMQIQLIGEPFASCIPELEQENIKRQLFEVQFYPYYSKTLQKIPRKHYNRWLEWVFNSVRDKDNNLIEIIGVAHDISDEMIVKELLQKSEANLRAMINNHFMGFLLFDMEYQVQAYNIIASEWIKKVYGTDLKENTNIIDIITVESNQLAFFDMFHRCLDGETVVREALLFDRKKNPYWFEFNFAPIYDNQIGKIGVCMTGIDISKRKQYEQTIAESLQHEKELNEIKSRLVSAVSHEFRTPLAIISSSAQLLSTYLDKFNETQRENQFRKINNAITRTTSLLDEILMINYDHHTHISFNPTDCNLLEFCHLLVDEIKLSSRSDIEIKFNFKVLEPIKYVDENVLKHILRNLLSNAIKYSKQNGVVVFDVNFNNKKLIFTINDDGIGMSNEDLKRIYEPFYRGKNVNNISGTGIGMSIVKRFVEIHNGDLFIDSQLNIGTFAKVIIPITVKN